MQRLYKLAPRYTQMNVLIKDGLDSAHHIARMGQNVFMARYGDAFGSQVQARKIYEKAQQTQAMALNLLVEYGPMRGQDHHRCNGEPAWRRCTGAVEPVGLRGRRPQRPELHPQSGR
jgi:hypothetical protein